MRGIVKAGLVALLGAAAAASAQDGEPLRLYRVEVIVFAYNAGDPGEELFAHGRTPDAPAGFDGAPAVPAPRIARPIVRSFEPLPDGAPRWLERGPRPVPDAAPIILADPMDRYPVVVESPPGAGDPAGPGAPGVVPGASAPPPIEAPPALDPFPGSIALGGLRFRLLRGEELELGAHATRLRNLDAYDVLAHGGWVQEALPLDAARPFDLAYLGTVNPAGTIQLHVTRFLHLTFDLDYQMPYAAAASDNPFELAELGVRQRYSLVDQRRARSNELHYVDHPLFGVLVLVKPVPRDERAGGEPAA